MSGAVHLREDLREGRGPFLRSRRMVAALSLATISSLGLVALYQLGILKRLPQPSCGAFDTEKVNGSRQAYEKLEVPDAILGIGSYAATLGLAAMGGENRAQTQPWIPLALSAKAIADAAQAGKLTRDSWRKHGAFSIYSLIAAAATLLALPFTLPEAVAAFNAWKKRLH